MIKLLVSDLDGTLLYKKQGRDNVNEKTKQALTKMHDQGVDLIIATGRFDSDIKLIEAHLPKKSAVRIGMNGGTIYDQNDELVSAYTFTGEQSRHVYDTMILHAKGKMDFLVLATLTESRQFLRLNRFVNPLVSLYWRFRGEKINSQPLDLKTVDSDNAVLKYTLSGSKNSISLMKAVLSNELEGFEVMTSSPYSLEICPPNINKGMAVKAYMEQCGLTKEEVAFVGDAGNDIAGFQAVEYSFCLSHGNKTTQSYAKYVVKDVPEAIDIILLENEHLRNKQ